ncbi:MAG: hypothetical protein HRT77_01435 [Halioglobus sp.]|nr:hypothetical protein [Halioglobus sp.]
MTAMKLLSQYLVIALITLLGLEIALRAYAASPRDSERFIYDEQLGYRARPGLPVRAGEKTNSRGFNDDEHTPIPRDGSLRLAIIGDSFVYGAVAREHNFTHVLESLAQRDGTDLDVINMGISAAGPGNYLGLLKHDVAESHVDLVAVTIFVGNDITQAHPHFKTSVWLNSTRETLEKPYLVGPSWEYSYVYRSIRSVSRTIRERLDKTPRESFTRENFMAIERQRSVIFRKNLSGYVRDSYEGAIYLIEAMSAEAKRQGLTLVVILAPDELQISSEIQDYLETNYHQAPQDYDFGQPQSILTAALSEQQIAYIDLLPFFHDSKDDGDFYIEYDTHWNEHGNRLAAHAIWRFLKENGVL